MTDKILEDRINSIDRERIPAHIAIIMDGNGRWAAQRNLPRIEGHRRGVNTVRKIVRLSGDLGIEYLTLYTFSSENWRRPASEVWDLMKLLSETLYKEIQKFNENNVKLMTIGDTDHLPVHSRKALKIALESTANNTGLVLNLAINYSGRFEIISAVKRICHEISEGVFNIDKIDEDVFSHFLDTSTIPDPDLFIRTSGEMRISNFLLWQLAYTEIWVTDVLWPEFGESDFLDAIESYQARERRFGKTSEQIKKK